MQETQEMQFRSLDQNDPLEEGMATHSNILAWRMPWTVEPGRLQSMGLQRVEHDWSDLAHMHRSLLLKMWSKNLGIHWKCRTQASPQTNWTRICILTRPPLTVGARVRSTALEHCHWYSWPWTSVLAKFQTARGRRLVWLGWKVHPINHCYKGARFTGQKSSSREPLLWTEEVI